MHEVRRRVAENIREHATRRGLSLNKLADFAGVSQRQLYSFLAGDNDVTLEWVQKVAEALGVDLHDLTTPHDPP